MNRIKFIKADNYGGMSGIAAAIMMEYLKENPAALFCLPTGSSPTGMYQQFVRDVKESRADVSRLRIVKLDEWQGIPLTDPATCESYLRKHILTPLDINDSRYLSFNSCPENIHEECARVSEALSRLGQIDLCILGLGKNGHLGLNEPGAFVLPDSHAVILDEKTKSHDMLSKTAAPVSLGVTLGIGQLLSAKRILFLVSGEGKEDAFTAFQKGQVSSALPASYLWLHENTTCVYVKK